MIGDTVIQMLEVHGYQLSDQEKSDVRLAVEVEAKSHSIEVVAALSERIIKVPA